MVKSQNSMTTSLAVVELHPPTSKIRASTGKKDVVLAGSSTVRQEPKENKAFPWELLPYELREQIFVEVSKDIECYCHTCGHDDHLWASCCRDLGRGKDFVVPPLIAALRILPISYEHAVKTLWTSIGGMVLNGVASAVFSISLAGVEPKFFTKIHITLGSTQLNLLKPEDDRGATSSSNFQKPHSITNWLRPFSNVSEVYLRLNPYDKIEITRAMAFVTEFPFFLQAFESLAKLTVEIPRITSATIRKRTRKQIVHGQMARYARCFKKIGARRQLVETIGDIEIWVWEAKQGRYMDWSRKLGTQWKWRVSGPFSASSKGEDAA